MPGIDAVGDVAAEVAGAEAKVGMSIPGMEDLGWEAELPQAATRNIPAEATTGRTKRVRTKERMKVSAF